MAAPQEQTPKPVPGPKLQMEPESALSITDGTHSLLVSRQGDKLHLSLSRGDQAVFSATVLPDSRAMFTARVRRELFLNQRLPVARLPPLLLWHQKCQIPYLRRQIPLWKKQQERKSRRKPPNR